ncbi:MAG: hypothetical protein AB7F59_13850 [Bdellovibrionales bacterium]
MKTIQALSFMALLAVGSTAFSATGQASSKDPACVQGNATDVRLGSATKFRKAEKSQQPTVTNTGSSITEK